MKFKRIDDSDRVAEFKKRAERTFFATISAFIDKEFFKGADDVIDTKALERYNHRATESLKQKLSALGLNYQKVNVLWGGILENSFLVWNTAYEFEQFREVLLNLASQYKQWAVCIGRKTRDEYAVEMWETNSLENIHYKLAKTYTAINVVDAIKGYGTILTMHIYGDKGEIVPSKMKDTIMFEELYENHCLASSESLYGAYKRADLIKKLRNKELKF